MYKIILIILFSFSSCYLSRSKEAIEFPVEEIAPPPVVEIGTNSSIPIQNLLQEPIYMSTPIQPNNPHFALTRAGADYLKYIILDKFNKVHLITYNSPRKTMNRKEISSFVNHKKIVQVGITFGSLCDKTFLYFVYKEGSEYILEILTEDKESLAKRPVKDFISSFDPAQKLIVRVHRNSIAVAFKYSVWGYSPTTTRMHYIYSSTVTNISGNTDADSNLFSRRAGMIAKTHRHRDDLTIQSLYYINANNRLYSYNVDRVDEFRGLLFPPSAVKTSVFSQTASNTNCTFWLTYSTGKPYKMDIVQVTATRDGRIANAAKRQSNIDGTNGVITGTHLGGIQYMVSQTKDNDLQVHMGRNNFQEIKYLGDVEQNNPNIAHIKSSGFIREVVVSYIDKSTGEFHLRTVIDRDVNIPTNKLNAHIKYINEWGVPVVSAINSTGNIKSYYWEAASANIIVHSPFSMVTELDIVETGKKAIDPDYTITLKISDGKNVATARMNLTP